MRDALTVLVVEDDPIIAMDMAQMVQDCGFNVLGPAPSVARAMVLLEADPPDAAVLDINLGDERSWPIAHALHSQGAPFVLATGYSSIEIEDAFRSAPLLTKPILEGELRRGLETIGLFENSG